MPEDMTFTITQAQLHFATDFHGKTWEMLEKKVRTPDEDERMLDYAHASLAHWRTAGAEVPHQRGEWLLARVYSILGESNLALKHAHRCYELSEENKSKMADFDVAFACEAVARAHAVSGDKIGARKYIDMAKTAGEAIKEKEDRDIFFAEFNGGDWHGMK